MQKFRDFKLSNGAQLRLFTDINRIELSFDTKTKYEHIQKVINSLEKIDLFDIDIARQSEYSFYILTFHDKESVLMYLKKSYDIDYC